MADDQSEHNFPSTDDFESFDDKDAEEVEKQLPGDSFMITTADFTTEGCEDHQ